MFFAYSFQELYVLDTNDLELKIKYCFEAQNTGEMSKKKKKKLLTRSPSPPPPATRLLALALALALAEGELTRGGPQVYGSAVPYRRGRAERGDLGAGGHPPVRANCGDERHARQGLRSLWA